MKGITLARYLTIVTLTMTAEALVPHRLNK